MSISATAHCFTEGSASVATSNDPKPLFLTMKANLDPVWNQCGRFAPMGFFQPYTMYLPSYGIYCTPQSNLRRLDVWHLS